ncbi:MAG: cadherin domain-containing protein, partial [Pseudomonadota bacterium]
MAKDYTGNDKNPGAQTEAEDQSIGIDADVDKELDALRKAKEAEIQSVEGAEGGNGYGNLHYGSQGEDEDQLTEVGTDPLASGPNDTNATEETDQPSTSSAGSNNATEQSEPASVSTPESATIQEAQRTKGSEDPQISETPGTVGQEASPETTNFAGASKTPFTTEASEGAPLPDRTDVSEDEQVAIAEEQALEEQASQTNEAATEETSTENIPPSEAEETASEANTSPAAEETGTEGEAPSPSEEVTAEAPVVPEIETPTPNQQPDDIQFSNTNVDENAQGATIATLSANDADADDTAAFTITEDSSGQFEIIGNELKLKEGVSLDHEAQDAYDVTVQVEDSAGNTYEETVTINVADINEDPTDISLSGNSVNESHPGATVATLSSTDVDEGDTATYSLVEDSSELFEVVGNELKLKDGVSADFEDQDTHEVTIQVEDSAGNTYAETVTINVADINENPTDIEFTPTSLAGGGLSLNQDGGNDDVALAQDFAGFPTDALTVEVSFTSSQTDVGSGVPLFSYAASDGHNNEALLWLEGSSGDLNIFLAGKKVNTGISNESLLDGEQHQVSFTWDQATNELKVFVDGELEFEKDINIRDLKDEGSITLGQEQDKEAGSFDSDQIFEGEISEVRIFNHARTDQDIADNANQGLDNPQGETGLVTNWVMDSDEGGVVSDLMGNNDLVLSNGADVADAVNYDTPTVAENVEGAVVAILSSTDVDTGDTATYSIADDASGLFEVVGNELKLKEGISLDHEAQEAYDVSVQVEDSAGNTYTETVTVNVADVNEGPTDISVSGNTVNEGDAGATVATLSSADVDDGDTASYSLANDPSGLFEVVGNELKLKDGVSTDYEGQESHDVAIKVTDGAGNSYTETVTVNVADINEDPSDILFNGQTDRGPLSLNQDGGNDDLALAQDFAGFPTDALTVEVSFTSSQTDVGNGTPLFSYSASDGNHNEALIWLEGSSGDLNIFLAGKKFNTGIPNESLLDGEQHQVSFTWDQATNELKVFVDGELEFEKDINIR